MPVAGVIIGVASVVQGISKIFGSSTSALPDTVNVDRIFQAALNDGPTSRAHAELKCWAGINDAEVQKWNLDAYYRDKAASGYTSGCSSKPATESYAKVKLGELDARYKAGSILATGGVAAEAIAPGSTGGAVWRAVSSDLVPIVLVVGAVILLMVVIRKRRG